MKRIAILAALIAPAMALAADPPASPVVNLPTYDEPARPWVDVADATARQACREGIERVRAEPQGDQAEPLHHHAVDHRVEGCGVLVPVADKGDLRSPPEPGKPELKPLRPEG